MNKYIIKDDKGKLIHNEFVKFFLDKYNYMLVWWKPMIMTESGRDATWWKQLQQNLIKELENQFDSITVRMVTHCMFFLTRTWEDKGMLEYNNTINKDIIHLYDWLYDTTTDSFTEYSWKDLLKIKSRLPYTYKDLVNGSAKPKARLKFLNQIFYWEPDIKDNIKFIQEFMWLLLVPNTSFEKALYIYWSGGNWKWVLLNTIQQMLDEQNCSWIWLNELMVQTNKYSLIWKLCNVDFDMFSQSYLDKEVIKKIISWETISAKLMYSQPVEFKPYSRIICASNYMPRVRHTDNSIARRFFFLELKNNFVWKEDYNLKTKLTEEKAAIFRWSFWWLKRLLKNWKFTVTKQILENERKFLRS